MKVNWDDDIPNMNGKTPNSWQPVTTNQMIFSSSSRAGDEVSKSVGLHQIAQPGATHGSPSESPFDSEGSTVINRDIIP